MEFEMLGKGMGDDTPWVWVSDFPFLVNGDVGSGGSLDFSLDLSLSSSSESSTISQAGISGGKSSSGALESQTSMNGSFHGRQSLITHLPLYSSTVSYTW